MASTDSSVSCFSLGTTIEDVTSATTGSETTSLTISPPSYSVREKPNGVFFNDTLNLAWPQRPNEGRFSLKEFYARKNEFVKLRHERVTETFERSRQQKPINAQSEAPGAVLAGASVVNTDFLLDHGLKREPKWFFGQMSPLKAVEAVEKLSDKLGNVGAVPVNFGVFYPYAEPDFGDLSLVISPILVYKRSNGIAYFFELYRNPTTSDWKLNFPGYTTPGFSRLKQLVDYIRTTGFIDPASGRVENLPVWHVDNEISSAF
uniref:SH2 domain-containing protein n=1 Tax=Panagrellus redivivus TaxID=6233 RepID=A0A7E4VW04_PANRE